MDNEETKDVRNYILTTTNYKDCYEMLIHFQTRLLTNHKEKSMLFESTYVRCFRSTKRDPTCPVTVKLLQNLHTNNTHYSSNTQQFSLNESTF